MLKGQKMTNDIFSEVMQKLESFGTEQNRKVYKKHGSGDNLFGVSFANLGKLQKEIKKDHELAAKLWETGNIDAQTLATMIADPSEFSENDADNWVSDISYYMLVDVFVSNLIRKTTYAKTKMENWIRSADEWTGRAGWQLLAHIAMQDKNLEDNYFENYISEIEKRIHDSKNRTKDAMNNALIAIGIRNENLEKRAIEAADRIGRVDVDHGDTSCKTPNAADYIKKAKSRKKGKK